MSCPQPASDAWRLTGCTDPGPLCPPGTTLHAHPHPELPEIGGDYRRSSASRSAFLFHSLRGAIPPNAPQHHSRTKSLSQTRFPSLALHSPFFSLSLPWARTTQKRISSLTLDTHFVSKRFLAKSCSSLNPFPGGLHIGGRY